MTPATFTLSGITFDAGAAAFVINPHTAGTNGFTLSGGIIDNAVNNEALNDAITLTGGTQTFTDNSTGTLTLGAIANSTGGLTISSGTGAIRVAGSTGTIAGVLNVTGNFQTSQDFHCDGLAGTGNISDPTTADKWFFVTLAPSSTTETFAGSITGGLSKLGLNFTGPGTLILTGANVINDQVTVNSGTLVFSGTHTNTTQVDVVRHHGRRERDPYSPRGRHLWFK